MNAGRAVLWDTSLGFQRTGVTLITKKSLLWLCSDCQHQPDIRHIYRLILGSLHKKKKKNIWRWFEIQLKCNFYRCVSVRMFWPLIITFQSVFVSPATRQTMTTSNPESRKCIRAAKQTPCCYWQSGVEENSPWTVMMREIYHDLDVWEFSPTTSTLSWQLDLFQWQYIVVHSEWCLHC